ncbi:hypothetical protein QQ045_028689 [Rhodiola kirilowii]
MYADDLLIFTNGHANSVNNLLKIMNSFCDMSGQKLNAEKSYIFFSKHFRFERKNMTLEATNFKGGSFPTKYLGAPLFPGRTKIAYFKGLEDAIRNKIMGWSKSFLKISGRATLFLSVLSSLSIHTVSVLLVLKLCIQSMERLFSNFLWDGKHHWVPWESICLPKVEGGLGIKSLEGVKESLLSEMAWSFLLNDSPLARFNRENFWKKSKSSGTWSAIKPLIKRLRRESHWTIGRGEIFVSPFCDWLDSIPPKEVKHWMVKDIIKDEGIRTKLSGWLPNVTKLIIDSFQLNDLPDRLSWRVTTSGRFSAKAFYEFRRNNMPKDKIVGSIWQYWIPPKISGFV